MRAPDYAEALIGWRVWCVVRTPNGLRLASVIRDQIWEEGVETVAHCEAGHDAPEADCACGIYAAREPEAVLTYLHGRDEPHTVSRVLGRVLLWGTVVEHEHGWRASHALPLELYA